MRCIAAGGNHSAVHEHWREIERMRIGFD